MWQPYMTGINITVEAPPSASREEVLGKAEQKLSEEDIPVISKGSPIYIGADQWIVGCTDYPIGPPINVLLKDVAMEIARKRTKERDFGGDLIVEEIAVG